ncbi:hypothetical protein MNBD_GAMMA19-1668, partial [hydrothermal vent metagenome]
QKLTAGITFFARYGSAENTASSNREKHYSTGLQFAGGLGFNPEDTLGIGYAYTNPVSVEKEKLLEAYYNLAMTEKLHLTFNLTYLQEQRASASTDAYVIPGMRLQASF